MVDGGWFSQPFAQVIFALPFALPIDAYQLFLLPIHNKYWCKAQNRRKLHD
jgi:hypothetical protein